MDEMKTTKYLLSLFSPNIITLLSTPCCISPTLFLPDCSTFSLYHLINIITIGYTTGFAVTDGMSSEEIKEIKDAAIYLSVDLKDLQLGDTQTLHVNNQGANKSQKSKDGEQLITVDNDYNLDTQNEPRIVTNTPKIDNWGGKRKRNMRAVSYTHLTLPTNREV